MQNRATTPKVIYDALLGDPTFLGLVGVRTFASGTSLPAISIQSPGSDHPPVDSISGLEVLIWDIAPTRSLGFVTDSTAMIREWSVVLLAWPEATPQTLMDAVEKIKEIFSDFRAVDITPMDTAIGAVGQVMVKIPSTSVIRARVGDFNMETLEYEAEYGILN